MNYYNVINAAYTAALKSGVTAYRTMIQPLDHWENVLGELTDDILHTTPTQQTVGSGSGVRRSVSVTVFDEGGKYSPHKDSMFWFNRKFRLWEGVQTGGDTYWQPQGVYYATHADEQNGMLTVQGVDKFGALNGEINRGECVTAFSTDISAGDIIVADLIRETLGLNTGSLPLDPITPIIDPVFESTKLYADISLNAGQYYGEVPLTLASMYGADCFYDRSGVLNFRKKAVNDRPWWYIHQGHDWVFDEGDVNITENVRKSTDLKAVNTVTVMSDNTEGEVYAVTVRNENPESPICAQNIGEQYPDEPVVRISLGDTTRGSGEEKCRQYGQYLLCRQTALICSETFTCAEIPHLDTDRLISLHGEDRLITALNVDHASRLMQISCCNINALPLEV